MSGDEGARRAPGQYSHRTDGRWQTSLVDRQGKRVFLIARTRAELKQKVAAAQKDLLLKGKIGTNRQTVAEYLRGWLVAEARPTLRASTYASYERYLEQHVIPALGAYRLDRLSAMHVQAFLAAEIESGRAVGTVVLIRAILRRALARAVRFGEVSENVAALTTRPKGDRPEPSPLTPEQAVAFIEVARTARFGPLYEVAITTGLRLGELLGLRWSDVSFPRRTLSVAQQLQRVKGETLFLPPKTRAGRRHLTLPELTAAALRRQRALQAEEKLALGESWTASGLVFTRPDGTPLDPTTVSHEFAKLVREQGLPPQRFHDLRHLAASLLLAQGHSLKEVSETLGHASITVTADIYGHLYEEQRAEVADGMDAILRRHGVSG